MSFRSTVWFIAAALALAGPLAAQQDERWQVTLDGERYVWDIRLVRLEGDSLVVRQADTLVGVPVAHITEVRLIRKSEVSSEGDGVAAMNALVGADDEIYDLLSLSLAERRRAIQKILQLHPTGP
jgi:hypothetical protein